MSKEFPVTRNQNQIVLSGDVIVILPRNDKTASRTRTQNIANILFWLLLAAWTLALEMPVPESVVNEIGGFWSFVVAKTLHFGIFGSEMFLGLYAQTTRRGRIGIMALLSFQAIITEVFQYLLNAYCHRHGCIQDVLIDHVGLGIGLGTFTAFAYFTKSPRNAPSEKAGGLGPV